MVVGRLAIQMLKSMEMHLNVGVSLQAVRARQPDSFSRYTRDWQEDRAVAAGVLAQAGMPGEESPNSAGQCAG